MFEEEKKFDSRTLCFFWKIVPYRGVFWPRRGLQANHGTVRRSPTFPQQSNQKQLNTTYVNK